MQMTRTKDAHDRIVSMAKEDLRKFHGTLRTISLLFVMLEITQSHLKICFCKSILLLFVTLMRVFFPKHLINFLNSCIPNAETHYASNLILRMLYI